MINIKPQKTPTGIVSSVGAINTMRFWLTQAIYRSVALKNGF